MMQGQIELLKTRLVTDKKGSVKEIDQTLQITQKETMVKQQKKEIAQFKAQV